MQLAQMKQVGDCLWEIPRSGQMRVPARIYATRRMMQDILQDKAPEQAVNVACMPGIVKASLAMPDIHWGYGFPIGGVAAFDLDEGVISPGGVGYDINCGVRLMASDLDRGDVVPRMRQLVDTLFERVPTGVGRAGGAGVSRKSLRKVARDGARWAVDNGYGQPADLEFIEEGGRISGAEPEWVSERAWKRGAPQIGSLGSGNHFVEVGHVAEIYDDEAARALGLRLGQVTVIIHTGSRGFGHQTCDDYLGIMDVAMTRHGIRLPDRQLACAPVRSEEGRRYLGAMRCAVNFAFANRQVIADSTRKAFQEALGLRESDVGLRTGYEVAHNIAKFEKHEIDGVEVELCVHRKGATRAFGPGRHDVPARYQAVGQPVLIPGDMGRYSYVLVGTERAMAESFGSTCHGAGRRLSRRKAKAVARGRNISAELAEQGITIRGATKRTVDEEIPEAYKDVADVVEACARAGISKKVAQLRPLGVIKG
jgi:tRNA-splicing ligase RtcB